MSQLEIKYAYSGSKMFSIDVKVIGTRQWFGET